MRSLSSVWLYYTLFISFPPLLSRLWSASIQKVSCCCFKLCSNPSDSLSIKHLRLSAVRNVWLFMMTICILFVMIALHQYSPLQPSLGCGADIFPPSAPVLLLLSGASWSRCCRRCWLCLLLCCGLQLSNKERLGDKRHSFLTLACLVVFSPVGFMSGWTGINTNVPFWGQCDRYHWDYFVFDILCLSPDQHIPAGVSVKITTMAAHLSLDFICLRMSTWRVGCRLWQARFS